MEYNQLSQSVETAACVWGVRSDSFDIARAPARFQGAFSSRPAVRRGYLCLSRMAQPARRVWCFGHDRKLIDCASSLVGVLGTGYSVWAWHRAQALPWHLSAELCWQSYFYNRSSYVFLLQTATALMSLLLLNWVRLCEIWSSQSVCLLYTSTFLWALLFPYSSLTYPGSRAPDLYQPIWKPREEKHPLLSFHKPANLFLRLHNSLEAHNVHFILSRYSAWKFC